MRNIPYVERCRRLINGEVWIWPVACLQSVRTQGVISKMIALHMQDTHLCDAKLAIPAHSKNSEI